jgi:hypothetical protein
MKTEPTKCPICASLAKVEEFAERTTVVCLRCGSFAITSTVRKSMPVPSGEEMPKISGWIRENQGVHRPPGGAVSDSYFAGLGQYFNQNCGKLFATFPDLTVSIWSGYHYCPGIEKGERENV